MVKSVEHEFLHSPSGQGFIAETFCSSQSPYIVDTVTLEQLAKTYEIDVAVWYLAISVCSMFDNLLKSCPSFLWKKKTWLTAQGECPWCQDA